MKLMILQPFFSIGTRCVIFQKNQRPVVRYLPGMEPLLFVFGFSEELVPCGVFETISDHLGVAPACLLRGQQREEPLPCICGTGNPLREPGNFYGSMPRKNPLTLVHWSNSLFDAMYPYRFDVCTSLCFGYPADISDFTYSFVILVSISSCPC